MSSLDLGLGVPGLSLSLETYGQQ